MVPRVAARVRKYTVPVECRAWLFTPSEHLMTLLAVVMSSQIGISIRVSISSRPRSFYCSAPVGKSRSERQGRESDSSEGERRDVKEFGGVLV